MVNPKVSNIAADPSQARPARQVCAATPRARYEGREPAGQSGGPARDGEQQARPRSRGSHLAIDLEGPRAGGAIHESERERAEHESRSPPMWQPRHRRASHRRAPRGDPRRQHSSRREAPPLFSKVGATHGHLRGVRSTGRPGSARRARRTRALAQARLAPLGETLRPRPTLVPRDRPGLVSQVLTFEAVPERCCCTSIFSHRISCVGSFMMAFKIGCARRDSSRGLPPGDRVARNSFQVAASTRTIAASPKSRVCVLRAIAVRNIFRPEMVARAASPPDSLSSSEDVPRPPASLGHARGEAPTSRFEHGHSRKALAGAAPRRETAAPFGAILDGNAKAARSGLFGGAAVASANVRDGFRAFFMFGAVPFL